MQVVLRIAGILLAALGVAVGLMVGFSPGVPIEGLSLGLAAELFVGGVLALGLGGIAAALRDLRRVVAGDDQPLDASAAVKRLSTSRAAAESPLKSAETVRAAEPKLEQSRPLAAERPEQVQPPAPKKEKPSIDRVIEEVQEFNTVAAGEVETPPEEELYVVEERVIAGKPARILSDGTVEAETDEGWMRFENFEHLQEYTDAMRARRP
jgi:hypothetical protein